MKTSPHIYSLDPALVQPFNSITTTKCSTKIIFLNKTKSSKCLVQDRFLAIFTHLCMRKGFWGNIPCETLTPGTALNCWDTIAKVWKVNFL